MGATSNPNAARLAALQERKKAIEESLAERNKELRQLCIQVRCSDLMYSLNCNYIFINLV